MSRSNNELCNYYNLRKYKIFSFMALAIFTLSVSIMYFTTKKHIDDSIEVIGRNMEYQGIILNENWATGLLSSLIEIDRDLYLRSIEIGRNKMPILSRNFSVPSRYINFFSLKDKRQMGRYFIITDIAFSYYLIIRTIILSLLFSFFICLIIHYYLDFQKNRLKLSLAKHREEMASQVAHDIRSPLSALNMVMGDLNDLPETTRLILRSSIQRIQDIANGLASKKKKNKARSSSHSSKNELSKQLLSACIEEIISEKRLHFRRLLHLTIESNLAQSYGIFAKINLSEFKRVLSNLINNAVEAFDNGQGNIAIHLKKVSNHTKSIQIIIEDNGKGIPENIMAKLGQRGLSFGKEESETSGSGLGLYHAKTTVESWQGKFTIESQVGRGTKMILTLPQVESPPWFVEKLNIESNFAIVILDDDQGIHQTWSKKLEEIGFPKEHIFHLCCPDTFSLWVKEKSELFQKVIYLCDFELIGFKKTGLDLIEEFSLGKQALLITSHYEEEDIQKRCEKSEIKLIPKMIVAHVPVAITTPQKNYAIKKNILLDDDILTRMVWESKAKEKGISLEIFEFSKDLYQNIDNISKDSIFYIDSSLSNNEKGEDVALGLFNRGYKNLYMATGHEPDVFEKMDYLKGAIGKAPPW